MDPTRKSRANLLKIAKSQGFVRYSSMNKQNLINLINRGHNELPRQKTINDYFKCLHSSKGIDPSEFLLPPKERDWMRYTVEIKVVDETSYKIRGVDLTGLFNATFIQDRYEQRLGSRWQFDSSDEDDDQELVTTTVTIDGGWIISKAEYANFCTFYNQLVTVPNQLVTVPNQPKSLFEIAAWIVNSKKQKQYIPKQLRLRLKELN